MRILDNLATYLCPHGGQVTVMTTNNRVKAEGARFFLRATDMFLVVDCTFNVSNIPSPCAVVRWINESKRVKVMGTPVLLESSIGVCINASGKPQGAVMVMEPQNRVKAL